MCKHFEDMQESMCAICTPRKQYKTLECSSRGDVRFSALYAKITINGITDTIENHYQLAKRFGHKPAPKTWREAKGRRPTHFMFNGKEYPLEHLTKFYNHLWKLYLDSNPSLVEYLLQFDLYKDCFARPNCNDQAKAIGLYMDKIKNKEG